VPIWLVFDLSVFTVSQRPLIVDVFLLFLSRKEMAEKFYGSTQSVLDKGEKFSYIFSPC